MPQKEDETLTALFRGLNEALCDVIGTAQSMRVIGESLPTTAQENADALCPELVFPALANGVNLHANSAMSIVEQIKDHLSRSICTAGKQAN